MAYINGVWTLIPDTCNSRVDTSKAGTDASLSFYINEWQRYVQTLMVDMVPGIVMGSISAAGFVAFLLWMCVWLRRRKIIKRARRAKKEHRAGAKEAAAAKAQQQPQFVTAGQEGVAVDAAAVADKQPQGCLQLWWERVTAGRVLKWAILVFGLAVVGVSAWGLAESINATDGLVDDFWRLVDGVNALATDLAASLAQLGGSLSDVSATLGDVQGALQDVVNLKVPIVGTPVVDLLPGGWGDKVRTFLGPTADQAVLGLQQGADLIESDILPVINDTVLPALNSVYSNQDWSLQIQDKWRYITIAVLFGLLILFAAAVAAACFTMRHGLIATFLVACLWALTAVVMFVGLGALNGAKTAANDACLYSEDLVFRLLNETLSDSAAARAQSALEYYFGQVDLVDSKGNVLVPNGTDCDAELTAALLRQVADIDIASGLLLAWNLADQLPSISALLNSANLPNIPLVNLDLDSLKAPITKATDQLQGLLDDVCNTTQLLVRENRVWPLYMEIKAYICCDLTSALYDVWLPWVIAGALALVLCVLASIRVVQATVRPTGRADFSQPLAQPELNGANGDGGAVTAGEAAGLGGGQGLEPALALKI